MKLYQLFLSLAAVIFSHSLNALVITDTLSFNKELALEEYYAFDHDFTDDGFLPGIDKITGVRISFDFREIVEGDTAYQEDEPMPDDWEFIILYSEVFDRRMVIPNVNTGLMTDYVIGAFFGEFGETGRTTTTLASYTNNLWLGNIVMEIDVDRALELPEPSPLAILGLGLIAVGWARQKVALRTENH